MGDERRTDWDAVDLGNYHAGAPGLQESCTRGPGARRLLQDAGRSLGDVACGGCPNRGGGPACGRSGNARGSLCRANLVRAARRRLRPHEAQTTAKHGFCCWTAAFVLADGDSSWWRSRSVTPFRSSIRGGNVLSTAGLLATFSNGTKRTCQHFFALSALRGKADMAKSRRDVRF